MAFIKANTSEYLVVGKKGKINNLGVAASAYIWPGWAYVRVPSVQQEAIFENDSRESGWHPTTI